MKYYFFAVVLLFSNLLFAQAITRWSPEKKAKLDSFFLTMETNKLFNGGILIAEQGRVIYQRSAGYWNAEQKILNSDHSSFNLASVSKSFTSLAILQLTEKKKLQLDDPYSRYFPDFPYTGVTIRQLLNHTSGLPSLERMEEAYIRMHPDEIISNEKIFQHLLELRDQAVPAPGERWGYNNLNYVLLAALIEKVSKMQYAEYMQRNIFKPAGMKNTLVRDGSSSNTPRYIIPFMYETVLKNVDSLDHRKVFTYYNLGGVKGPGNIVSTLADLFQFDNALSSGKLVNNELLETAFNPTVLKDGKTFYMRGGNRSYGLGWNVMEDTTGRYVFHDGHIVGITAMLYKNLSRQQTIIFYDNTDAPYFFQKIGTVSRILNDLPVNKVPVARSLARVYGEALVSKGADHAISLFNTLKQDTANYYVDELEMNTLGLQLISADLPDHGLLALEVLKINTLLYPKSANTYDSYAEALARNGKKEEAIRMYEKSIRLNPNNQDGIRALKKLTEASASE